MTSYLTYIIIYINFKFIYIIHILDNFNLKNLKNNSCYLINLDNNDKYLNQSAIYIFYYIYNFIIYNIFKLKST
jgi:hypothetical protein